MKLKMTEDELTNHIERYFQSQRAFVDQAIADVTLSHDDRLRLVQTLVHNAYREGMQFATGVALGSVSISRSDDEE